MGCMLNKAGKFKGWLSLLIAAFALTGCPQENPVIANPGSSSTSCGANQAQILVGEAYVEDICGCAEGNAVVQTSGQALNCTVSANTQIAFSYLNTVNDHQIISTGSPNFPSSPTFGPSSVGFGPDPGTPLVWAVTLSDPGTYTYTDAYYPNVLGAIIVQ
jgi:hypothetical protein